MRVATLNTAPKKPEAEEATLTQAQSAALPLLAAGSKKKDAASAAGVCPQTISVWMQEPHFSAVLREQREHLTVLASERLREAAGSAVATVLELMESGSEPIKFKAATYILDRIVVLAAAGSLPALQAGKDDPREFLAALGVNYRC
jgi:hypothetical protein